MQSILQFFVIDFSATYQDRRFIFCMLIDNDLLHRGTEIRNFLSTFLSKISPQLYKIESLYLVYRITATSCIVG